MERLSFWIPLRPDFGFEPWQTLREQVAAVVLAAVVVGIGVVVWLYSRAAHRLQVVTPADPFRPYTPLHWLRLSLIPAIVSTAAHAWQSDRLLEALYPADLLSTFAITGALTWLVARLVVAYAPKVTPPKFRYHPRFVVHWLWHRTQRS